MKEIVSRFIAGVGIAVGLSACSGTPSLAKEGEDKTMPATLQTWEVASGSPEAAAALEAAHRKEITEPADLGVESERIQAVMVWLYESYAVGAARAAGQNVTAEQLGDDASPEEVQRSIDLLHASLIARSAQLAAAPWDAAWKGLRAQSEGAVAAVPRPSVLQQPVTSAVACVWEAARLAARDAPTFDEAVARFAPIAIVDDQHTVEIWKRLRGIGPTK